MSDYVLSCCSTADLTPKHFEEGDIHYVCFHYELDGVFHPDDCGKTMPLDQFYQAMANGAMTKTSQVNAGEYEFYFRQFLDLGLDILHLCLSSGISGSINSAMTAKAALEEEYPDRKIIILDSYAASSGYGLLMDELADRRDLGYTIEELRDWAEEHRLEVNHWFFTTDLTYLVRGGRVSKAAGFVGNVLNICPLLNVDYKGRLIAREKCRGKNRVIKEIVQRMVENANNGPEYSDKCYLCQSACREDAEAVASLVEEKFPRLKGKIRIYDIGTTIGSHTGPGTVALFFMGKKRVD